MNSIRIDVEEFVIPRLWVPGKHTLVLGWLVGYYLFRSEFCVFAIRDAPETVGGDFCGHVVVFVVDYEVYVVVAEFLEWIVNLFLASAPTLIVK